MKISEHTLAILKSFAVINQSIYVEAKAKKLSTIAIDKNIVGRAQIEESFPVDFGIYDLNEFLMATSLFDDPDFDFSDKFVTISEGSSNSLTYRYV